MFTTIMTVINIIALVSVGVGLFISRYTIVDLETWNTIATFYNEHNDEETDNCGGGCGFFWNYLDEVSDDVLDEPDEDE